MMQRKNKVSNATKTTLTEQISPLIEDSSNSNANSPTNQDVQDSTTTNKNAVKLDLSENDVVVASVVRRSCGTSPFDRHWLNVDCCGLFCASLTYMLLLYGAHAVCNILIPPWMSYKTDDGIRHITYLGYFNIALFLASTSMAAISHFKAMTTNPGAVPPDAKPMPELSEIESELEDLKRPRRASRICRRCHSYKPPRAHHCSVCRRCIIKMDHHCPWVNNCVGIGNHKYFLLFVFYTFVTCMYAFCLLIMRIMACMSNISSKTLCLDDPTDLLRLMGLGIESLLFGLFTSCMMVDQWDVVATNLTHIDRLKGEQFFMERRDGPNISEVFGIGKKTEDKEKLNSKFQGHWLSPFVDVLFPDSINDQIMGFCRPCGIAKNLVRDATKRKEEVEEIL